MKVLHCLDHSIPLHSGYTFRTRAILEHQRALGWETVHVTSAKHSGASGAEEVVDGLRFFRTLQGSPAVAKLPVINQWAVVSSLERRLMEVIDLEQPDVLHAHSPSLNGVAAIRAGRRSGIPVVYECRAFWEDAAVDHGTGREWGLRYRISRHLETWVFRQCDAITCICDGLRTDILARGIPVQKVTVIPNGVDLTRFQFERPRDEDLANELGIGQAIVLGFLGSFYTYEGLVLAIRALPQIIARWPMVRLLLVGGGPQEAELRALSTALGLDPYLIFAGRVPHDQVQRYYSVVDVLLYPRLAMRLTDLVTPLKPLEAMAQGKLIIASDVGGHRELIHDGDTGLLFLADNVNSLVGSIFDLLGRRDQWEGQRRRGRTFVERERNWGPIVTRYGPVYEHVIRGGGQA